MKKILWISMLLLSVSAVQAQQLADLQERATAGDTRAAALLENIGKSEMGEQQAGLDIAYQNFLAQRDNPRQQLSDYSAILRGLPLAAVGTSNTTGTSTPAQASGIQQLLGAGTAALGLYKGLVP
jgi:hypothetical protein